MQLLAVALVCATSTPAQACDRTTAIDVVVSRLATPIECAMRGQTMIAGSPLGDQVGRETYVKVICERQKSVAAASGD
jgi:hypothetical protein